MRYPVVQTGVRAPLIMSSTEMSVLGSVPLKDVLKSSIRTIETLYELKERVNLRGSGAIEQDADVVIFVHREEYYDKENLKLQRKAEIIIGKQRNGPVETVEVVHSSKSIRDSKTIDRVSNVCKQQQRKNNSRGNMKRLKEIVPQEFAKIIGNAKAIVALTGAGISTAAGIPDFRGRDGVFQSGKYDLEKSFEIACFDREPSYFFSFYRDFAAIAKDVHPTFTHIFLNVLERIGAVKQIITQNIDMLHQTAGSRNVLELHGSTGSAICQSCRTSFTNLSFDWWLKAIYTSLESPVPLCKACGTGILKPDIVFYGEPMNHTEATKEAIEGCDLLLVLGSSLSVSPASYLPYCTKAPTVAVNRGPVHLDPGPDRYYLDCDLDALFHVVAWELSLIDTYGNFSR